MGNCKSGGAVRIAPLKSDKRSRKKLDLSELCLIGQGGEKAVHSCKYDGRKAIVAVARGPEFHERVLKEIALLTAINAEGGHPHIVKLLASGILQGDPYLVLEPVEPLGRDLNKFVKEYCTRKMRVPSSFTARIFHQLISALEFLHARKIIHRDVKTENVLLSADFKATLIDFGVSGMYGAHPRYTCTYMAPEVVEGKKQDGAVDAWGLGLILHQMYQLAWNILSIHRDTVTFKPGMPSSRFPMVRAMQDAMHNLLRLDAGERWTLKSLSESPWLLSSDTAAKVWSFRSLDAGRSPGFDSICPQTQTPSTTATSTLFVSESASSPGCQKFWSDGSSLPFVSEASSASPGCFVEYGNAISPIAKEDALGLPGQVKSPTCLSMATGTSVPQDCFLERFVTDAPPVGFAVVNVSDHGTVNKKLLELSLHEVCDAKVLMITPLPPGRAIRSPGPEIKVHMGDTIYLGAAPSTNQKDMDTSLRAKMFSESIVTVALEFDCFRFPEHMGECTLESLKLRDFRIDPIGIMHQPDATKSHKSQDVEWFPSCSSKVCAGDLCIMARTPLRDGSTAPSMKDKDVKRFLLYAKRLRDVSGAACEDASSGKATGGEGAVVA